jgi:POT family proton-dependent oligopeptide transporter
MGLALLGLGFMMFSLGSEAAVDGMVPVMYLILAYLLHTVGELCLSPVGLSLVTKLAPARIVGFVMGIWFLSSSIAHQAGKWIAKATSGGVDAEAAKAMTPAETLPIYTDVFTNVGFTALGAALFLLLLSPLLKKWMHGVR